MTQPAPPSLPDVVEGARAASPGLLHLVGNTPLVPITRINPNPKVEVFAKLEGFNPGGSVKDRIALAMIQHAERSGALAPDKTILEATSGNTGIGLAMVSAVKGYRILLAMSEGVSLERRKILAALGAEFLLTPAEKGTDGAIEVVYEMAGREPDRYYLTDQYNNEANILAHYHGTAMEIWRQTEGRVTHFVASLGTTGTLMGTSRRLRELSPGVGIVGVEPYLGHRIQGLKNMKEAYLPGIYDRAALTEKVNVEDDAAYEMARVLARQEGLLVGMSSGAAMHVALELVRGLDQGVVVVLLPDGGERYLSTPLFQVAEDLEPEARLQFVNTYSKKTEVFTPIDPEQVSIYTCGPTVHARPHLGLYRRILVADLVRRAVELAGHPVRLVMNVTDVDDRTLAASEKAGVSLEELTREVEGQFMEDLETLGVKAASEYPRASDYADDMIGLTRRLIQGGFAYEKLRSVYFNIGRFADYGALSGMDLKKVRLGATVDLDSYEKDDPRDFTLLKRSTLGELKRGVSHKTEWGNVRPGWHVECAAMALTLLGEQADIHVGGVDLVFPHHENEIAICQAATGKPPARCWIHSGLVMVDGRMMSRSAGNAIFPEDVLERGYTGRQLRHYLLSQHYRQPFHFSYPGLDAACASLERVDDCVRKLRTVGGGQACPEMGRLVTEFSAAFREAIYDDLNIAVAGAALLHLVRGVNRRLARGEVGEDDARSVLAALDVADGVLGVLAPGDAPAPSERVAALVADRQAAREARDFARADELRARIESEGYVLEDTPRGPQLRPRRST